MQWEGKKEIFPPHTAGTESKGEEVSGFPILCRQLWTIEQSWAFDTTVATL